MFSIRRVALIALVLTSSVVASATPAAAQMQPRDPRPDKPRAESPREAELKRLVATEPANLEQWLQLAKLQEERGAYEEAEATFNSAVGANPDNRLLLMSMSGFFNRLGQFDKTMTALERAVALMPSDPQGHQLVAVYYYDKAAKDQGLGDADKLRYVDAGLAAVDRALALKAEYGDAMVYKGLLLRLRASAEPNLATREALLAEANALQQRAIESNKSRTTSEPPPAGGELQPVRVGGNIKTPTKIQDRRPVYPPEALEARVTGMVILEATIEIDGSIRSAKVLRSIPLLDAAAVEAVKGWRFEPTYLNGAPVPVIMTVTVNFALQ